MFHFELCSHRMHLFLRNVEYINGLGSFKDPHTVRVRESNGTEVRHITRQWDTGGHYWFWKICYLLLYTYLLIRRTIVSSLSPETASISWCAGQAVVKKKGGGDNELAVVWMVSKLQVVFYCNIAYFITCWLCKFVVS